MYEEILAMVQAHPQATARYLVDIRQKYMDLDLTAEECPNGGEAGACWKLVALVHELYLQFPE